MSEATDGKPFGDSAKFAIVPSLRVLYPNGGEVLMVGKTVRLQWESRGAVPEVRLELSRNRGATWQLIDGRTKVPNDGLYAWTVTGTKTSFNCLFRVSDLDGKPTDASDNVFQIKVVGTGGQGEPDGKPGTDAETEMLLGDEMELQPGALPWSRPWLEDLPAGTTFIRGVDGRADRLLVEPEDDGEYVGTEEDFKRDFEDEPEPPPGTGGGDEPGDGGEPAEEVDLDYTPPTGLEPVYYVYGLGGKLLAEYDSLGNLARDYIYAGNRLIAEYRPPVPPATEGIFYYYTPDQINSTRVVTNQNGGREHAYTYEPYGRILKVTDATYQPTLAFSGKERDVSTQLDYFGARWYAHPQYRWISVDPVMNRDVALTNPQLWNLYTYCENNPATKLDPDGRSTLDEIVAAANRFMSRMGLNMQPNAYYIDGQVSSTAPSMNKVAKVAAGAIVVGATVADLLKDAEPGKKSSSIQYTKKGDFEQANRDFDALQLKDVQDRGNGIRTGTTENGDTVVVRPESTEGSPTLEVQPEKGKTIKIRYQEPGNDTEAK